MVDRGNSGESQNSDQRIRFIVVNFLAVTDFGIKAQQACAVDFTAKHAVPDEEEVVIALSGTRGEKKVGADFIHGFGAGEPGVLGNCLAKTLREIGMPARPVQDALDKPLANGRFAGHPGG